MSDGEQLLEQPSVRGINTGDSRLSLSQEASCCRGSSCQRQPIDSSFVGPNGDMQLVNSRQIVQPSRYYEDHNSTYYQQPYAHGGSYYQPHDYRRNNHGYQSSNIPHVISDVITQQHSGYNQPYGYGFGNSGYQRSNIPHVIRDVITQQHNGRSYYNNPHGYQHRGGHGGGLQFNFGSGGRHHR